MSRVCKRWFATVLGLAACGSPARPQPRPIPIVELVLEPEPDWVKHDPPPKPPPVVPGVSQKPYEPKTGEQQPIKRETLNGHKKPPPPARLPDEVVVRVMDAGRVAFVRCFKKAANADPTVASYKVRLHVELDAAGKVTAATTDAADPDLTACLVRVANALPFPAPGLPATVDLPLFWRPER